MITVRLRDQSQIDHNEVNSCKVKGTRCLGSVELVSEKRL